MTRPTRGCGFLCCVVVASLLMASTMPGSIDAMQLPRKNVFAEKLKAIIEQLLKGVNPFANQTDIFTVIPGRYPDTVSLPEVLAQVPEGPQGKKFVQDLADYIYKTFGIEVPDSVVDLFFEDSTVLLNFLQFSIPELYFGAEALNLAYQAGKIKFTPPHVDYLPSGFDLANSLNFPLNMSDYMPGPPTEIAPNLYQGFYPGKRPLNTVKAEIVLSLALNQLSNNSHLPINHPARFTVVYNGQQYTSVKALLNAFIANNHSVTCYLTWRAVDFFGWLTKDRQGQWREVPVPVMLDTGVYSGDTQATLPAIHDEIVIEIRSGPNSKGYKFDGDLLWYEGDNAIGFFAGDLYSYASWVGTVNAEYMYGTTAVNYVHAAGVFSDVLLQAAKKFNLYDLGYGTTGICVDSIAVIEYIYYNEVTLYPLMMQTELVVPVLREYIALNNENVQDYKDILRAVQILIPDIYGQPSIKRRAYNTITWPPGKEPFEVVVSARSILQSS